MILNLNPLLISILSFQMSSQNYRTWTQSLASGINGQLQPSHPINIVLIYWNITCDPDTEFGIIFTITAPLWVLLFLYKRNFLYKFAKLNSLHDIDLIFMKFILNLIILIIINTFIRVIFLFFFIKKNYLIALGQVRFWQELNFWFWVMTINIYYDLNVYIYTS